MAPSAPLDSSLPDLDSLLAGIDRRLAEQGELGLLSILPVRRPHAERLEMWEAYGQILEQISAFLERFVQRRLRRSDRWIDPAVTGNTFVLMLAGPRDHRPLDRQDLSIVRDRLMRGIRTHLERTVPRPALASFGIHVGASVLRHDPAIGAERIVYRALEESIADALRQRERRQRRRSTQIQRLLQAGSVRAVYQPLVDLVDRRVFGFEALTRFSHSEFPTPDLLFKAAQESGALWRLERLCRQRALEGIPRLEQGQLLFLNIEPESMFDPGLCETAFLETVERAGLRPSRLVFELTEHSAIRDFDALRRVTEQIRGLGFRLAMDDVGSGYAGLQAIAELRPEFIKLDMTLIRDLDRNPIKRELIATIRRFTDSTGITLVAEGVESSREAETLAELGVRCAQGYLFARPDDPPDAPDWERITSPC